MIHYPYDPAVMFGAWADYPEWRASANAATANLVNWFSQPHGPDEEAPVDSKLYGKLKDQLKAYFHDKCAYCESLIDAVGWGDVDHFRPKLRVAGNPNHRGYYWLAYNESNLLPSCERCNRAGKRDNFPVDPANTHVIAPGGNLSLEHPLLLSPYDPALQHPELHWKFEFLEVDETFTPTGFVDGVSEHAKQSVKIYKLNRKWLVNLRQSSQVQAVDKLKPGLLDERLLDQALDELLDPRRQHSAAVRATCFAFIEYRARRLALKGAKRRGTSG
jgi:uncharacterized protein (TIGR02646 family)